MTISTCVNKMVIDVQNEIFEKVSSEFFADANAMGKLKKNIFSKF